MTLNRVATKVAETGTIPAATVLASRRGHGPGVGPQPQLPEHLGAGRARRPGRRPDGTRRSTPPPSGPTRRTRSSSSKSYPGYLVISAELQDRDAGNGLAEHGPGRRGVRRPDEHDPDLRQGPQPHRRRRCLRLAHRAGLRPHPADAGQGDDGGRAQGLRRTARTPPATGAASRPTTPSSGSSSTRRPRCSGTLTGSPNPTNGAATLTLSAPVTEVVLPSYVGPRFQAAEYWTGTTDPGVGKATRVQITDAGTGVTAAIPLGGLQPGTVQLNLRVQDAAGNWSNACATSVQVIRRQRDLQRHVRQRQPARVVGRARVGSTAALAAGIPFGGVNYGMVATLAGGAANAPAYVTDDTPIAETTYHAQFSFNAEHPLVGHGHDDLADGVRGSERRRAVLRGAVPPRRHGAR